MDDNNKLNTPESIPDELAKQRNKLRDSMNNFREGRIDSKEMNKISREVGKRIKQLEKILKGER